MGAQGCQKVPKWSQMGAQMCSKSRFRKKVSKVVWTCHLLYILTTGSFPRGASYAAPGLQNGAHGAEKWREWGPPGSPRLPKILQKNMKISIPLRKCLQECLGCPTAPKIPPFLTFPRPTLPQVGGTFEPSPPTLSYTPLTSSFANVKHPSSAAVWAYAYLD